MSSIWLRKSITSIFRRLRARSRYSKDYGRAADAQKGGQAREAEGNPHCRRTDAQEEQGEVPRNCREGTRVEDARVDDLEETSTSVSQYEDDVQT